MVGLFTFVPMALVIIRRVRDEEEILMRDLVGIENIEVRCAIAFYRLFGERSAPRPANIPAFGGTRYSHQL